MIAHPACALLAKPHLLRELLDEVLLDESGHLQQNESVKDMTLVTTESFVTESFVGLNKF